MSFQIGPTAGQATTKANLKDQAANERAAIAQLELEKTLFHERQLEERQVPPDTQTASGGT